MLKSVTQLVLWLLGTFECTLFQTPAYESRSDLYVFLKDRKVPWGLFTIISALDFDRIIQLPHQ